MRTSSKKAITLLVFLPVLLTLQAQNQMKNTIIFSNEPFSPEKSTTGQTVFSEGDPIYGRLILESQVKNFCLQPDAYAKSQLKENTGYNNYIVFFARPVDQDEERRTNVEIKLYLKDEDLNKTIIDFDIAPLGNNVTSFYPGWSFMDELANTSSTYSYFGSKTEMIIQLKDKSYGSMQFNSQLALQPSGNFTLDLTKSDYRSQNDWKSTVEELLKKVSSKYIK